MGDRPLKEVLLNTLDEAERRERVLMERCDDSQPSEPGLWTLKDHLIHLAHWRHHAGDVLNSARTGAKPPPQETIDEVNAGVYAANRDRLASEVKDDARASYAGLRQAIEACTEEQLLGPRPERDGALWQTVTGDGHAHTAQHLTFWLQSIGDVQGAEEAQVWAHDLHVAAFSEPEQQASAEYNLGCYYATQGRAAEAIPLIAKGIELQPTLREWARTDPDLDSIRDHPDVARLLG